MSAHAWGVVGLIVGSPIVLALGAWYVLETLRATR